MVVEKIRRLRVRRRNARDCIEKAEVKVKLLKVVYEGRWVEQANCLVCL